MIRCRFLCLACLFFVWGLPARAEGSIALLNKAARFPENAGRDISSDLRTGNGFRMRDALEGGDEARLNRRQTDLPNPFRNDDIHVLAKRDNRVARIRTDDDGND